MMFDRLPSARAQHAATLIVLLGMTFGSLLASGVVRPIAW